MGLSSPSMSYRTTKDIFIEELQVQLTEVVHEPTGAQILYLGNQDTENVFNLCFRTTPDSSNGVAHILEHTVLCGSKNFPVRDPFFGMTRRSLNTFMNAFTGADFTCYPAASEIPQDFYNLLDVYLDAVFHPLLTPHSFYQEGHRLEFEQQIDPSSPLQYKGIVYNEMKGALASGDARMSEAMMEAIFPNVTYGINSGGDPKDIPTLTYDQLKAFHQTYYHPSRCLFFFYGHLPLQQHLDFLEQKVFSKTQPLPPLSPIPLQPRFDQPKVIKKKYPLSENTDEKVLVGLGWLTCRIHNQEDLLGLIILDMLLMGTDAGLLKKEILASGLCKNVESALDSEINEIPYFIVCKGCKEESETHLQQHILSTLQMIAKSPIDPNLVEGALHQLEISRTEITGNSTPYGLSLFFRSGLLKMHGGSAEDGLAVHSLFKKLKEAVARPNYFSHLIERYLIQNPHRALVTLEPDDKLSRFELEEESSALAAIQKDLDENKTQAIISNAQILAQKQEEDEDYDILPKISIKDISSQGKDYPLNYHTYQACKIHHYPTFTNSHIYVDLVYDMPQLPYEDLAYFRLFILLSSQLGCGGRNYQENLDFILQHISAVGYSFELFPQAHHPGTLKPAFSVRGKCLRRKIPQLFDLMKSMLTSLDVTDKIRLKDLLGQHLYDVQTSLQTSPLQYAINLGVSGLTLGGHISEHLYGLHYYWRLKEIVEEFNQNPSTLISKLEQMKQFCAQGSPSDFVLCAEQSDFESLQKNQYYGLLDLKGPKVALPSILPTLKPLHSHGRLISSPVAFTAFVFPSLSYTHPDAPALSVAAEIMENNFLHTAIREQGGAYGAGASNSALSGFFYTYAYRDPHLFSSYKAFKEAIEKISRGKFENQDIEEALFGLFQGLDSPIAPGSKAITSFCRQRSGRDLAVRQHYRHQLLNLTKKSIQKAVEAHLQSHVDKARLIAFANEDFFKKENPLFGSHALPLETL